MVHIARKLVVKVYGNVCSIKYNLCLEASVLKLNYGLTMIYSF